jgi:hypothetical protein
VVRGWDEVDSSQVPGARSSGQSLTGGRRERNAGLDGHLLMGRSEGDTGVDTKQQAFAIQNYLHMDIRQRKWIYMESAMNPDTKF